MKNKIMAMCLAMLVWTTAKSQNLNTRDYSKWSVGIMGGVLKPHVTNNENGINLKNLDWGGNLRYSFTNGVALEARGSFGSMEVDNFATEVKINSEYSLNGVLSIGGNSWYKNYQSFRLHLLLGAGQINYTRGDHNGDSQNKKSFTQIGSGLTYRLGNRTNVVAEYSLMRVPGNGLIREPVDYTSYDYVSRVRLGFVYNLGKKKHIEWNNPISPLPAEDTVAEDTPKKDTVYVLLDAPELDTATINRLKQNTVPLESLDQIYIGSVFFHTGSFDIDSAFVNMIENAKKVLALNPNLGLKMIGYADKTGSLSTNVKLSKSRVEEVASYIRAVAELEESRVVVDYRGEEDDVLNFSNATSRRVDIYIYTK